MMAFIKKWRAEELQVSFSAAVYLNKQGEIVETKEESFGLPTKYIIHRPDKLVFVDEVGSNTSTTKDGNFGGEKFYVKERHVPR